MNFPFLKGHGTHNDFVVLPDLDGRVHGDLDPDVVVRLCDRRGGIGADGVLRVLRADGRSETEWFMDFRNADGSTGEMCGNGIRVFARFLQRTGLVSSDAVLPIATRAGERTVTFCDDGEISVDMGVPRLGNQTKLTVEGRSYDAQCVDMGNPHAVVFVDTLDEMGDLAEAPTVSLDDFPHGVNVEFVVRQDHELAMRVFERGVGETQSCGTGACASAVVCAQDADDEQRPTTYVVQVPGGSLTVTWQADDHVLMKGAAELVAEGVWTG
ncbi:MAG: diaminopimelate epimerase [Nocardioidaceae bacterium]